MALNPVRVKIGAVTSHQIEALFEAFDAICGKAGSGSSQAPEHSNESVLLEEFHKPQEENAIVPVGQAINDIKDTNKSDEAQVTWSGFIEDFKQALARKDVGEILMLEFERSKKTGKRKQLRKRLVECLSGEPMEEIIPEYMRQAEKMRKKSLADLFAM